MKPLLVFSILATIGIAADVSVPASVEIAKTYAQTLTRVTDKPRHVGREFALLCKPAPLAVQTKKYGPHLNHFVHYFGNDLARNPAEKFPAGAVIVKEKLVTAGGDAKPEVKAVAGMIKQAAGASPRTGDWEFFWFEGGKVNQQDAQSCAGCHSGAKRDYVFSEMPKTAK